MNGIFKSYQRAGAILLFALAYFFDSSGVIMAMLIAAAVHELGHVAALKMMGAKIQQLRISFVGLEMEYRGQLLRRERVLALAAGPAAGGIYALLCLCSNVPFWRLSSTVSAVLTTFNLLPALPLDGGRLLLELCGMATARRCSLVVSAALFFLGVLLLLRTGSCILLGMSVWLLLYHGIVR